VCGGLVCQFVLGVDDKPAEGLNGIFGVGHDDLLALTSAGPVFANRSGRAPSSSANFLVAAQARTFISPCGVSTGNSTPRPYRAKPPAGEQGQPASAENWRLKPQQPQA
jgi:hypothetical protein